VCSQAGLDLTGELSPWGSHITLRGRLVPATLRLDTTTFTPNIHKLDVFGKYGYRHCVDGGFYLRADPDFAQGGNPPRNTVFDGPSAHSYDDDARRDSTTGSPHDLGFPVYCFLVARSRGYVNVYFLVLRRIGAPPEELEAKMARDDTGAPTSSSGHAVHRYLRVGMLGVCSSREGWDDEVVKLGEEEVVTIY
jgi:hypothetical protein